MGSADRHRSSESGPDGRRVVHEHSGADPDASRAPPDLLLIRSVRRRSSPRRARSDPDPLVEATRWASERHEARLLSCPDHLVRLARLRAPGMRCALHWASGARRLEAGVKEVEQTSSAAAGECDGRFDTGKGHGSQTASSRRPWRMVDLATRPVQAGRPQTLVEAAQTFVERPILPGTRFEIPGAG